MEDESDDTGNKAHNKELGCDFRNVVALSHNSPDGPYHAGNDSQQYQLVSKRERKLLFAILCEVLTVLLIRLIGNGNLRVLLYLCCIAHGEHTGQAGKDDP